MEGTTLNEGEFSDATFGRAIAVGIVVGLAMMFVVVTGMVFIGGLSIGLSAGIAVWVGFVIGPYAGGLTMLGREDLKAHHRAEVVALPTVDDPEHVAA